MKKEILPAVKGAEENTVATAFQPRFSGFRNSALGSQVQAP